MTRKSVKYIAPSDGRPQPVRVRLERINCDLAKAHPPDGEGKLWWARLKKALGTSSSAFVNASLFQLQGAARLPGGGISEIAVNGALAIIEAVAPKDEVEAALAVQMAASRFYSEDRAEEALAALAAYCRRRECFSQFVG
jgi:hypothetical protein